MGTPANQFLLYHGNDLEMLAGILAAELARPVPGRELLAPDTILIPQPAMRRWLQKTLAETHGIAANLRFLAPGEFVREALDANVPGASDEAVGDAEVLRWRLWRVLADPQAMAEPVFAPLAPLFRRPGDALAPWTLAGELASAFEKYQAWRRDWLRRWDRGADSEDWQAQLWRRATRGLVHRGRRLDSYLSRFDGNAGQMPAGLPPRVFAFACQNVSPDVLRVIASSARAGTLHFFFLSPVAGWWGDLVSARERLHANADAVFGDLENPLLRANGAAGRDFVRTLFSYEVVHPDKDFPLYVPPDPKIRTGLLHRLQRDLLARRAPPADAASQPAFDAAALADGSLQVHACHTRLREVQVLHDQLRELLERDPRLQPREIAVLTPDIDAYAPFVQAVFAGEAGSNPVIPYALSDGSSIANNAVAEAFTRLLDLPDSRFAINDVLDLLSVSAIAERFELETADFDSLRQWLGAAGARWGLNAEHRAELDAPPEAAFSWAWALDRLLLGHATGNPAMIAGVAPLPTLEGGDLLVLDRLLHGLRRLAHWQRALAVARVPADWSAALGALLTDFFPERARDNADRDAIDGLRAHVATFARQAAQARVSADVPAPVVRAWFKAALAEGDGRQPFLTGGVTFGRMVPMRLVPFKVICLLGMNDGEFPRRDPPGSLNRLAAQLSGPHRQVGDRSVRDDDRGLFLQLFAAATQAFYVSYLGRDPRSGESLPPSVVVSELLDVAAQYFASPDRARKELTVAHPLQPFSVAAVGGDVGEGSDARRFTYQAGWANAAALTRSQRAAPPAFAAPLAEQAVATSSDWTRDQLVRVLSHPARAYLTQRLGLRLPDAQDRLPDEEPFDSNQGLERFQLDARVLDACLDDPTLSLDALAMQLLAEARIAPGAAGRVAVAESLKRLGPALGAWRGRGGPPRKLAYSLDLDGLRLDGVLSRVHADGMRQFSDSKGHGKTVLALGVDALAWFACGETAPIERIVSGAALQRIEPIPVAQARDKLSALLALAQQAQASALVFMPRAGLAMVAADDLDQGLRAAAKAWSDKHGEGADAWVQLALRGGMPFASDPAITQAFANLSHQVFGGLPGMSSGGAALDDHQGQPSDG
ncbi:MAG: exodeoxyribonuclease V subunit gamma [Gammaproteobacteria bacterium]|nr:exodeoxyribonuclease V subunit gamma [Gammaproteobacteria bacterium]